MESSLLMWCWVFLVLVSGNHFDLCFGCADIDRRAPLEVKASMNSPNDASFISSWEEDGQSNCCKWEGVGCSSTNGRVEKLYLSDLRDRIVSANASSWEERKLNVNASVFAAFDELSLLDLSRNYISFERLSGLKKLELLDLSYNELNASILPSLGTLSSLRSLNLAKNSLEASAYSSIQVLSSLKKLERLDLSGNRLSGAIPPSLSSLKKLEVLDLSDNRLSGAISLSLGSSSSLKALSLSRNQLNGSIQGLCRLQKLQELDLSENELNGGLPQCLGNLTSLEVLDLSRNKFEGSFPSSIITNHTCLLSLAIYHNQFDGTFSLHWFANHTQLKIIDLRCDNGKLEVETEHPTWVPSFQLEAMYVSNCNLNRGYQGAAIPSFLSTQYALREIDMSHNRLSGSFPPWLLKNNTTFEALILRNNSITGPFDLPPHFNTSIQFLDISDNHINGYLPTNIGLLLPKLNSLNMSKNALHGDIPSSLGDVAGLATLDLQIIT